MASAAEQADCALSATRPQIGHFEGVVQLPYEIYAAIFRTLPTPVVVHRIGAVCKDWHAIVNDDELWRLRCGLSELPSGFSSWFTYAQCQTMREQALYHLYGRADLTQNWRKGLQLLSALVDAGDDYAMALYGWALYFGVGIRTDEARGLQLLQQSRHVIARAYCSLPGLGMNADADGAFRLLSTECDASDPHVQFLLGWCHNNGIGCNPDEAQAVQYFERADNHVAALANLAFLLSQADCPIADRRRAIELYRQAATQGHAFSQYSLGHCYEQGIPGVLEKDIVQAKHWCSLSAEQSDS